MGACDLRIQRTKPVLLLSHAIEHDGSGLENEELHSVVGRVATQLVRCLIEPARGIEAARWGGCGSVVEEVEGRGGQEEN